MKNCHICKIGSGKIIFGLVTYRALLVSDLLTLYPFFSQWIQIYRIRKQYSKYHNQNFKNL